MALSPERPWNVLIFPAASEIGLEIHRALRDSKEVLLHGAAQPGPSPADFHFRRLHPLPSVYDPVCLRALQKLVAAEKIDAVFPAHDDVVLWLAEKAAQIPAAVLTGSEETAQICRSKRLTYEKLGEHLPVPKLWAADDPALSFPVFVKPDRGQGSHRARLVSDRETLARAQKEEPDLLITENLPGAEYTVDCFSHRTQGVLFARARKRIQTRTGISTRTAFAPQVPAREWAEKINKIIPMRGAWFFQLKEDSCGQLKLLEVAPRIAGSMACSRVTGPNFPLLSLYEAAGFDLTIDFFDADLEMGRSLDARFLYRDPVEALYLDLDDVLLLRGEVNTRLVGLIFQFRNRGVPVCLVTKHRDDLDKTLAQYRLHDLFDRIEHLPSDPAISKAAVIKEKNAVLIDDSFRERQLVRRDKPNVRCFDAAGALCLWDERA